MLNRPIPKSSKVGVLGTIVIIAIAAVLLPMAKAQKKDSEVAETGEVHKQFVATLPNGVTVELVGLTYIPVKNKPWWQPGGKLLELGQPLFHKVDTDPDKNPYRDQLNFYAVAYRLNGKLTDDVRKKWQLGEIEYADTVRDWSKMMLPFVTNTNAYIDDKLVTGIGVASVRLPKSAEAGTLRLGIASGQWQTLFGGRHLGFYEKGEDTLRVSIAERAGGLFGVRPGEKGIHIDVTYNITDRDFRVVAVDKTGKVHVSSRRGFSGTKNLRRTTASFRELSRDQLQEYRFQVRDFEWVEFKNVSLQPGVKTDVQVEVKIESVDNKVPAAMVGTWFFDNPHGDEEQMAVFPDGRVVVLYSNGHKDQTNYVKGFIELSEYDNAKCKMAVQEDGNLVQYFNYSESERFAKRWRRIDSQPRINLLRSLTGLSEDWKKFFVTLPNGVTVELVGVCEHPSKGNKWWRADGTMIEGDFRPYAFKELRSLRLPSNQQENKILELAVKITDSSNRNVGMICSGANRTFVNCRNNIWGGTVEVGKEPGVKDFKIGVAAGAWETLASSGSKFGSRRRKTPGIVFTEAYNTQKGYAVVIVTHKKDIRKENWRVVAMDDKEGKPHKADLYQTQGIGEFEQNMFHFKGLRSEQIKRFEFQTRPYQWIIFKNVSLQPGKKTNVQVEAEKN